MEPKKFTKSTKRAYRRYDDHFKHEAGVLYKVCQQFSGLKEDSFRPAPVVDGWSRCRKLVSSSQAITDSKEKKGSPNTAYHVHGARGCWFGFIEAGEWSAR